MIRCRQIATLLSTDRLADEPRFERVKARIHLLVCPPCRTFRRQLAVLRQAARDADAQYDAELGPDFIDRVHDHATR